MAKVTRQAAGGSKTARRRAANRALAAARDGHSPRRRLWLTIGPVAVVLALIATLTVAKVSSGAQTVHSGTAGGVASSALVADLASVPVTTLNTIGAGTAGQAPFTSLPTATSGAALTANGLPQVLYVGAEYCPYCAAERWAVAVALSRFGSFNNLGTTSSSPSDVYPNTASLSFHGASFTSSDLAFNGYEIYSNQAQGSGYAPLDTLPSADNALFQASGGSFPYINIGGKYVISGASLNPGLLAGKTTTQIAAALSDPNSAIAKAIDGTANVITAAVCKVTGGQPGPVCTSAGVVAAQAKVSG
jgi:hypothetical protein